MSGSTEGGKRAATTNKAKYGEDFYSLIGTKGGKLGKTGGFASQEIGPDGLTGLERARKVGILGGRKSKRVKREDTHS